MRVYYRTPGTHFFNDDTNDKVGVIISNFDNEYLVVKGVSGKYSLPKGSRKIGETDWEAAERECWEEAGIDISELNYKGRCKLKHGTYFVLGLKKGYLACKPNELATLDACWMSKHQLRKQDQLNADLRYFLTT